jgi:hypothetical protein
MGKTIARFYGSNSQPVSDETVVTLTQAFGSYTVFPSILIPAGGGEDNGMRVFTDVVEGDYIVKYDGNTQTDLSNLFVAGPGSPIATTVGYQVISDYNIVPGGIGEVSIANDAITSNKIANNAVTSGKIGTAVISGINMVDNAITSSKIQNGAVIESKLGTGAVTSDKIANGSIISIKIPGGAIYNSQINSGANISPSKLAITDSLTKIIMSNLAGYKGNWVELTGDVTLNSGGTSIIGLQKVTGDKLATTVGYDHTFEGDITFEAFGTFNSNVFFNSTVSLGTGSQIISSYTGNQLNLATLPPNCYPVEGLNWCYHAGTSAVTITNIWEDATIKLGAEFIFTIAYDSNLIVTFKDTGNLTLVSDTFSLIAGKTITFRCYGENDFREVSRSHYDDFQYPTKVAYISPNFATNNPPFFDNFADAYNSLGTYGPGEGTMIVYPGTYIVSQEFLSGMSIIGTDKSRCILQCMPTALNNYVMKFTDYGSQDSLLKDLTLFVSGTDAVNIEVFGIKLQNANIGFVKIENCDILVAQGSTTSSAKPAKGIYCDNSNLIIKDSIIEIAAGQLSAGTSAFAYGLYITEGSKVQVTNSKFKAYSRDGDGYSVYYEGLIGTSGIAFYQNDIFWSTTAMMGAGTAITPLVAFCSCNIAEEAPVSSAQFYYLVEDGTYVNPPSNVLTQFGIEL